MTPRNRASQIQAVLRQHVGRDQAISAPGICRILRWPLSLEREVRRIIKDEGRSWGGEGELFVVCAIPGRGFFIAADFEEIQNHDNWLSAQYAAVGKSRRDFRTLCKNLGITLEAR